MNLNVFLKYFFSSLLIVLLISTGVSYGLTPQEREDLRDATVAAWTFDEGTGTTAFDSTPNGNDGTLEISDSGSGSGDGEFTSNPSVIGSALDATSTGGGAGIFTSGTSITDTGKLTISLWYYNNNFNQGAFSDNANYIFHTPTFFLLLREQGTELDFEGDSFSRFRIDNNWINENQWHHIVVTVDDVLQLYVDGNIVYTTSTTGVNENIITPFAIGRDSNEIRSVSQFNNFGDAYFDELLIFDRALSSSEIEFLFNNGAPTVEQQWDFSIAGPSIQTDPATDISFFTATLNGELLDLAEESSVNVFFQYREEGETNWISTSPQSRTTTGTFSQSLSGLEENQEYEFRAVVTWDNGQEEAFGNILTFTTLERQAPTITTNAATDVSFFTATLNGNLDTLGDFGTPITAFFEYREEGETNWFQTSPSFKTSTGAYSFQIDNLKEDTLHEFRAVAVYDDPFQRVEGSILTFTTELRQLPTLTTLEATNVGGTSATLRADITLNDYTSATLRFFYNEAGQPLTLESSTISVSSDGIATISITGLDPNTEYEFEGRLFEGATQLATGGVESFTTLDEGLSYISILANGLTFEDNSIFTTPNLTIQTLISAISTSTNIQHSFFFGEMLNFSQVNQGPYVFTDLAFGDNRFVGVGAEGLVMYSDERINWSFGNNPSSTTLLGVTFGNNRFVAVGLNGQVLYSDEGLIWDIGNSAVPPNLITPPQTLLSVTFGNNRFVAVGNNGEVVYSDDGINWNTGNNPNSITLRGVTFGNNRFIAVGNNGEVIYSDDGINWSSTSGAGSVNLNAVSFGAGLYVAVGDNGAVRYSSDGETWTTTGTSGTSRLLSITYGNGRFVASGDNGAIRVSLDGITWTTIDSLTSSNLQGITFGVSNFVTGGDNGQIFTTNITQYSTNSTLGTFDLVDLEDNDYSITLQAQNNDFYIFETLNFRIDTSPPTITNTIPQEIFSYDLNLSQFLQIEDISGIDTAFINFTTTNQVFTKPFDSSITFSQNGNIQYEIFANDTVGNNITTTGSIFVNPLQFFQFNNNRTSSPLSDYIIRFNNNPNQEFIVSGNVAQIPLYSVGIGNHTYEFIKSGFVRTQFEIEFNLTSEINQTQSIEPVNIAIEVFDFFDLSPLEFSATLLNQDTGETFLFQDVNNLDLTVDNVSLGNYEIVVTATDYASARFYGEFSPFTAITIKGYLTELNFTDVVLFTTRDFDTNAILSNVLIEVQRLRQGTYETISQVLTDNDGQGFANLDSTQEYRFVVSRDGYTTAIVNSIPAVTQYTLRLRPEQTRFDFLDGVNYFISPIGTNLNGNISHNFTGFISGSGFTEIRFRVIDVTNDQILNQQVSTNPTGTTFNFNYFIEPNSNISEIRVEIEYFINGKVNTITKRYNIFIIDENNAISLLRDYAMNDKSFGASLLRWFIMMIVFGALIVFAVIFAVQTNYVSLILLMPIILFTFIAWIPYIYGALISFLLLVIWRYNTR